jgi:secreted trypsin-like serine protease
MVAGHRGLLLDSCRGDSGGPLYIRNTDGEYFLIGATSRGIRDSFTTCGDGGIYVRVDLCLDWIRNVTGVAIESVQL